MRTLLCCLLAAAAVCAERTKPLTMDDLHGAWEVDAAALAPAQKEAAAAAKAVEGFGVTCTLRTCRVILSADRMVSGMWRLDEATPASGVLVIQPRGQDETRFTFRYDGKHLVLADDPAGLPLRNTRKP